MKFNAIVLGMLCMSSLSMASGLVPKEQPISLFKIVLEKQMVAHFEFDNLEVDTITDLYRHHRSHMTDRLRDAIKESDRDRAKLAVALNEIVAKTPEFEEELLREVLRDNELEHVKTVWRKREIERKGVTHFLERSMRKEIDLTDNQLQEIKQIEKKMQSERQDMLEKLQQKQLDEVIAVLDSEQKTKFRDLLGSR